MFIDYLEGNTSVPDAALAVMGQHGSMTVYVSRIEHGQPTKTVTKKQYYGFKVRWRFANETQYRTDVSSRLHHTIYFEQAHEGERIILSAAWMNSRLQEGPWYEDVTEIIV
jgi:hypothetical protein